jgi:hypothetical protein
LRSASPGRLMSTFKYAPPAAVLRAIAATPASLMELRLPFSGGRRMQSDLLADCSGCPAYQRLKRTSGSNDVLDVRCCPMHLELVERCRTPQVALLGKPR